LQGYHGQAAMIARGIEMDAQSYHYGEPAADDFRHHDYLIPAMLSILKDARPKRIFDLGCGNGLSTSLQRTAIASLASIRRRKALW